MLKIGPFIVKIRYFFAENRAFFGEKKSTKINNWLYSVNIWPFLFIFELSLVLSYFYLIIFFLANIRWIMNKMMANCLGNICSSDCQYKTVFDSIWDSFLLNMRQSLTQYETVFDSILGTFWSIWGCFLIHYIHYWLITIEQNKRSSY